MVYMDVKTSFDTFYLFAGLDEVVMVSHDLDKRKFFSLELQLALKLIKTQLPINKKFITYLFD